MTKIIEHIIVIHLLYLIIKSSQNVYNHFINNMIENSRILVNW